MARLLGEAYIAILPDTDQFGAMTRAQVDKATAAIHPDVNVGAQLSKADIAKLQAQLKSITKANPIDVGVGLNKASAAALAGQIKAIGKGTEVNVGVTLNQRAAALMVAQLEAYMKNHTAEIGVQLSDSELAKVALTLDSFLKTRNAEIGVEISPTQLAKMQATLDAWGRGLSVAVSADIPATQLAKMKAELNTFLHDNNVELNILPAMGSIDMLILQTKILMHEIDNITANVDIAPALAKLGLLMGAEKTLADGMQNFGIGVSNLDKLATAAALARSALGDLGDQATRLSALDTAARVGEESLGELALRADSTGRIFDNTFSEMGVAASVFTARFIESAGQGGGAWGALSNKVVLFAGVLDNVLPVALTRASGLHILTDAAVEFLAVWGPATIAVAAWGAVAAPVFEDAFLRLQSVQEAAAATNTKIGIFNYQTQGALGAYQKLQNAVQPTVWELLGDALNVINARTGAFGTIVSSVSGVVRDLAARMTAAFESPAAGSFLTKGADDFKLIGTAIGDVGGILGRLMNDVPGYAEVLLTLGTRFLNVLETVVGWAGPIIKVGLAFHGFFLYTGLAVTGVIALSGAMAKLLTTMVTFAGGGFLSSLGGVATRIGGLKSAVQDLVTLGPALKTFFVELATNPVTWMVAAAALIGVFAYEMTQASNAAKAFTANILNTVDSEQASVAITSISTAIGRLNTQIDAAKSSYVQYNGLLFSNALTNRTTTADVNSTAFAMESFTRAVTQSSNPLVGLVKGAADAGSSLFQMAKSILTGGLSADRAENSIKLYSGAIVQLTGQQDNLFKVTGQVMFGQTGVTKQTYNYAQALGILDAAGVQAGDSQQVMLVKVQGLLAGWQQLGIAGGQAGNAVNALSLQTEMGQTSISKLTGAYSAFISLITSGETSLATFGQGMGTLATDLASAGAKGVAFSSSLSQFTVKGAGAAQALNGVSQAALNARSSFAQQVVNAQNLYNTLQTLASVSGQGAAGQNKLAQAGKDMIATLLPLAKGSQTATTELYGLAQVAGYKGPDAFKQLAAWVGNVQHPMQNLNKIEQGLTTASANLATDVQNLAGALSQTLTSAISAAVFQANGGQKVFDNFADALQKSGGQINGPVKTAAAALATSLIHLEGNTQEAENTFISMAAAMGLSKQKAEALWASLTGAGSAAAKTAAQTKALDATLTTLGGSGLKLSFTQANNLWNVLKQNTLQAVQGHAQSAQATFQQLATKGFGLTAQQAQEMWANMKPTLLDVMTSKASITKTAFENLANQGFGISKQAAGQMWTELREQYLDTLADKAGTAKSAFVNLAAQGLDITKTAATNLWDTLRKQYLDDLANKAGTTKSSFINLARQGLDLTTAEANTLWDTLRKQYLDTLANKAGTTKSSFINLARQGLDLTSAEANTLWDTLRKQYLDTLVQKGDAAKASFISLARQGLDLTTAQANTLWSTLEHQYLDTLSRKAGETEQAFVATAKQFGATTAAAETLWNQLKTLAAGKYEVAVDEVLSGSGSVTAKISAASIVLGGGGGVITPKAASPATNPQLGLQSDIHKAAGGFVSSVNANHSNTDTVPIMAKPNELIIPAEHAPSVAQHLAGQGHKLPGYSQGGFVSNAQTVAQNAVAATNTVIGDVKTFAQDVNTQFSSDVSGAFANAQAAASGAGGAYTGASSFGGGFESLAALVSFAKYFMTQGLNRSAAAGMAATISGEEDSAGPESRNCVPLTYKVVTTRGLLAHDEVLIGDQTMGYNVETGETELATILDVPYHYDAEMCTIGNSRWSVTCTIDHKWITKTRGLVRADRLRMGEHVMLDENWSEQVYTFERIDNADTFCLTTTTGTWTVHTDEGDTIWTGNSSGFGLIGWTGNTVGLPAGYTGPTGNVAYDLKEQLEGVIGYMRARGGAGPLNAAGNPVAAGDVWSSYEAPQVKDSDTRPAIANEIYAALGGSTAAGTAAAIQTQKQVTGKVNQVKPFSSGGTISEPVYGFGANSGTPYSFAENGPEMITPGLNTNGNDNFMQPMTQSQGQALLQALNTLVQQGQQLPYALTKVQQGGLGAGMRTNRT